MGQLGKFPFPPLLLNIFKSKKVCHLKLHCFHNIPRIVNVGTWQKSYVSPCNACILKNQERIEVPSKESLTPRHSKKFILWESLILSMERFEYESFKSKKKQNTFGHFRRKGQLPAKCCAFCYCSRENFMDWSVKLSGSEFSSVVTLTDDWSENSAGTHPIR